VLVASVDLCVAVSEIPCSFLPFHWSFCDATPCFACSDASGRLGPAEEAASLRFNLRPPRPSPPCLMVLAPQFSFLLPLHHTHDATGSIEHLWRQGYWFARGWVQETGISARGHNPERV